MEFSGEKVLENTKVILGVTGGIAAYKAVDLASRLTAQGAKVQTVMTEASLNLVCAKSFESITKSVVYSSLWTKPAGDMISHIDLSEWCDVIVVAPATANIIGKAAQGICDDLLSTFLCVCWDRPVLLAPAMNSHMWANPAVQKNVEELKGRGFFTVGPEEGRLASGAEGVGRMTEPEEIVKRVEEIVSEIKKSR